MSIPCCATDNAAFLAIFPKSPKNPLPFLTKRFLGVIVCLRATPKPTDLDTLYILKKSVPLLGKFSFLEIHIGEFTGKLVYKEI